MGYNCRFRVTIGVFTFSDVSCVSFAKLLVKPISHFRSPTHEGIILSGRNVLCLDCSSVYLGTYVCQGLFTCMLKMGTFYFAYNFEKKFKSTIISSVGSKMGPTAGEGIHWSSCSGKSFRNSFKH